MDPGFNPAFHPSSNQHFLLGAFQSSSVAPNPRHHRGFVPVFRVFEFPVNIWAF